ncbi:hypothetical protein ACFQY3_16945 [Paenibacillus farraposensis]|uniref:hypothetical protein n=1 Tax=Paenibacillus farraposensis TaxID=2807095 RepID=UPI00360BDB45
MAKLHYKIVTRCPVRLSFSFLGWYLNKEGLLVNIFQLINLLVGLLLFYLLFCVVSFIVLSFTPFSKELINAYGTYVPIPLSFLAIIIYIKKKKLISKSRMIQQKTIYIIKKATLPAKAVGYLLKPYSVVTGV